jgi:uncharacterized protein (DUF697 family)
MNWRTNLEQALSRGWQRVRDGVLSPAAMKIPQEKVADLAGRSAPVVWLIGKVQSGKTSIVRMLTHATAAEIGEGYKPCTRTAAIFDFPTEAPVIRFLDTRGLGEVGYDPSEDISFHEGQAHLILVVMRALDPQQEAVIEVLKAVRKRHPEWPVIVAQTALHEGYEPGQSHPSVYPFERGLPKGEAVPPNLARALAYQRALFDSVPGSGPLLFVPIDFTPPEDGYLPEDYGLPALLAALEEAAPAGLLAALKDVESGESDKLAIEAHPHIVGYATAAAAADVLPAAGAVAVPVVQSKMLHSLARIYGVDWNRKALAEFAACLGVGALSRIAAGFGLRQLAKLIPVYGQTAGAAAAAATSFATTFAIGKAACYFLAVHRRGASDPKGVAATYAKALTAAFRFFRERQQLEGGTA